MKNILIILFLILQLSTVRAQYPNPLPSSGPLDVQTIYNWMQAAGENPGSYSISGMNSKSHLLDKTAPYSLSDWYGYSNCYSFTVTHMITDGAPEQKTVTYGSVLYNNQCWITQNLGATNAAPSSSAYDEPTSGWYWQFNRKQGYKHNGLTRTPATAWINTLDNTGPGYGWAPSKDPCALLLKSGWRLPTMTEWQVLSQSTAWQYIDAAFNTPLRIYTAGKLAGLTGTLLNRNSPYIAFFWSSTGYPTTYGYQYSVGTAVYSAMSGSNTADAYPLRCVK